MYSEQLIQIFPNNPVSKGYSLNYYRTGELNSLQFLLLNASFSNVRPFIANKVLTVSEIYCITKTDNSPWDINVVINNITNQTFTVTSIGEIFVPNINLAINDTLSISVSPSTILEDVLVKIKLDYE